MVEGTVATAEFQKTLSRAEETFSNSSAELAIASEIILEARTQLDDAARSDNDFDISWQSFLLINNPLNDAFSNWKSSD